MTDRKKKTLKIMNFIQTILSFDKRQNLLLYLRSLATIYLQLTKGEEGEITYFMKRLEAFGVSTHFIINTVERSFEPYKNRFI